MISKIGKLSIFICAICFFCALANVLSANAADEKVEGEYTFKIICGPVEVETAAMSNVTINGNAYSDPIKCKSGKVLRNIKAVKSVTDFITGSDNEEYGFQKWEIMDVAEDDRESVEAAISNWTINRFTMPSCDVTLRALFSKVYKFKYEVNGLTEEELSKINILGNKWEAKYQAGKNITNIMMNKNITGLPDGKMLQKRVVTSDKDGTILAEKVGTGLFAKGIVMPESDVTLTYYIISDPKYGKALTVGEQAGNLVVGQGGSVVFDVVAEGFSDGEKLMVHECLLNGTDTATSGLSFPEEVVVKDGHAAVTVTSDQTVDGDGMYYFRIYKEFADAGKLQAVSPMLKFCQENDSRIEMNTVQEGELTVGQGGAARFTGMFYNIPKDTVVTFLETDAVGQEKNTATLSFQAGIVKEDGSCSTEVSIDQQAKAGVYYFRATVTVGEQIIRSNVVPVTVEAVQEDKRYDIQTVYKTEGYISVRVEGDLADMAKPEEKVTLEATPNAGYHFVKWSLAGESGSEVTLAEGSLTDIQVAFLMPEESVTAEAFFEADAVDPPVPPADTYEIQTTYAAGRGTVTILVDGIEGMRAAKGATVTLTANANAGFVFSKWSLIGNKSGKNIEFSEGTLTDAMVSFIMPEEGVRAGVTFDTAGTDDPVPDAVYPVLTSFSLNGVSGVIDPASGTVTVSMAAGTDATALIPAIAATNVESIFPEAGTARNFTSPVTFTLTSKTGHTRQYVVTVYVEQEAVADSLWKQIDDLRRQESWWERAKKQKENGGGRYPNSW